jgi:glucose-6-phosphate 1-epimerase
MSIEQLNREFGIAGRLAFAAGEGGFPLIRIDSVHASALVSVYAGQVLSYQPAGEPEDLLFVSKAAYYADGKAIKGGIPVCWPWFGPDPEGLDRPAHGFVRNRMWRVLGTAVLDNGEVQVVLGLVATDETRKIWPQDFGLMLEILVGPTLGVTLTTRNTGRGAFNITQALHTYFNTGDIARVSLLGLDGTHYLDKAGDGGRRTQSGAVTVATEVDRIYTAVRYPLIIDDKALGRRIRIDASGSRTAVVWNPWREIAARMGDLDDTDYQRFLCVETANAADEVVRVLPGEEIRLGAVYSMERQ